MAKGEYQLTFPGPKVEMVHPFAFKRRLKAKVNLRAN